MTAVPYPRPAFNANAIGQFQIGISPLGDMSPFDEWATVLSQYATSPRLTSLIDSFNSAIDQTQNIDNLYDMIWNIATAVGYGLDVWGRIVGVGRTLSFPGNVKFLWFNEPNDPNATGFGQGGFFTGGGTTTNFSLSDPDFKLLILAKAAGNICDGSIPAINQILLTLFPLRGACYVQDGQNMSLTYTFQFPLNTIEQAIVAQTGVLPNPCGVVINIQQL